jgi:hypothetical protein
MHRANLPSLEYLSTESTFQVLLNVALLRAGFPLIEYSFRKFDLMKVDEVPLEVVSAAEFSGFQRPSQTFSNAVAASIDMVF